MKRSGHLIERIAETENLRVAFWKAARGKSHKKEVVEFRADLELHLQRMSCELRNGTVPVGEYHYFKVFDPKERQICAASFRERVLHHAIMNLCEPLFERLAIFHSYACRKGKGQFAAMDAAKRFSRGHRYFLKLDVRKYFDTIDHRILLNLLGRLIKDGDLLNLFARLLESYQTEVDKGLPIGNLTSQHFANYYLSPLDRFVTEECQAGAYVRYMDDFVIWHHSRCELKAIRAEVESFLWERLRLNFKERTPVQASGLGIPFLGFRVFPNRVLLSPRSKRRLTRHYRQALKALDSGIWTNLDFQNRWQARLACVSKANCLGFCKRLLKRWGDFS